MGHQIDLAFVYLYEYGYYKVIIFIWLHGLFGRPVPWIRGLTKINPTKEVFLWSIFVLYLVCLEHNNVKVYLLNLFPVGKRGGVLPVSVV